MHVTFADFKDAAKPDEAWAQACAIGGFGNIDPTHQGGLDLSGLSDAQIQQIKTLTTAVPKDEKKKPA